MSDAENFQQFQTHMMAFFGHMFNTVKVVVQSVPAAGVAGHLLQQAEAAFNAAKVAAEKSFVDVLAPAGSLHEAPQAAEPPPPAAVGAELPATLAGLAQLVDDPAADPAVKAMAAEKMQKMLAAPAPVPAPLPPAPVEPAPEPMPAPEAPAVDVGVPPAYPQPDHSQP